MSLLRDRKSTAAPAGQPRYQSAGATVRWRSAMAGAAAAVMSMLTIASPVLLVWVASAESTVDWTRALSVGSNLWLLANGAHLSSGPATISLMPWLLTAIPLTVSTVAARRVFVQLEAGRPRRFEGWGGLRRDVADVVIGFVTAYAAVGCAVALVTSGHPLHASVLTAVAGTGVLSLVAALTALGLELRGDIGSVAPDLADALAARVPIQLRRSIRPALWGVCALLGAGLVLVVVMVVTHLGRISELYDALGPDPVGIGVLTLGQVLALPNIGLWAASWMAGPGFGVGAGTSITWSHSDPGLLPLIPGLGALPDPGPMPALAWLSILVPVGAGMLVGRRSLRAVARLSSWRVKVRTASTACVVAAVFLTLASVLAGGSLGAARLSSVGAPSLLFGLAVLGELLLGASVMVGLSHLRTIRR